MTRPRRRLLLDPHNEQGATVVIVALVLVAMFGMVVLVVDVGGLLWKRRELVNASDAAALSAAHTCALKSSIDPKNAQQAADALALQNVSGSGLTGVVQDSGTCHSGSVGWVKVQYSQQQHLFFAPVLGFSNQNGVTTKATAIWGPAGAANPFRSWSMRIVSTTARSTRIRTPGPQLLHLGGQQQHARVPIGVRLPGSPDRRSHQIRMGLRRWVPRVPNPGTDVKTWIDTYPNPSVGDLAINYPNSTYVCRVDGNKQKRGPTWLNLKGNVLLLPDQPMRSYAAREPLRADRLEWQ